MSIVDWMIDFNLFTLLIYYYFVETGAFSFFLCLIIVRDPFLSFFYLILQK